MEWQGEKMSNIFVDLVKKAALHKWCVRPYCTTCGCREFRNALQNNGREWVSTLSAIDPADLYGLPDWGDALTLAFIDLPLGQAQIGSILSVWFTKIDAHIRFADTALFRVVRNLPAKHEMREKWIDKCVELALRTRDFSLTETLMLVLGKDASKYPLLVEFAKSCSKQSPQMKRVLCNTGNL